jgi:hypothetical protein
VGDTTSVPAGRLRPWIVASREAALVALAGLALGEAVSFLVLVGGGVPGLGVANAIRGGVVLFLSFHHVGMQVATGSLHLPHHAEIALGIPSGAPIDATVAFALLGGMALVLWLLVRAGGRVGEVTGGRPRNRGLSGARVAVPYALVTFVLGWVVNSAVRFPETSPIAVHPSHAASLLWPLGLAVAAGFAGGVRSGPEGAWGSDWWEYEEWRRRLRGALAGAFRILLVGMALAVVGFLVVAAVRPGYTAQYVAAGFSGGPVAGLGVVVLAVLAIPNLALWVLAPAFGGCVEVSSGFAFTTGPYCFMSYTHAAVHPLAGRDVFWGFPKLGPPPGALWAFLVVPAVAVVLGLLHAMRVADVRSRRDGLAVGALTGVVFIGVFLVALLLSTVTIRLKGSLSDVNTGYYRYGPQPFDAFELGIVWAVIGGMVVGWLSGRRAERAAARSPAPAAGRSP